jgi:acetyl-CoA carboxylase beta subunit
MTASEACGLLVNVTRDLSTTRAERDSWRLVAIAQMRYIGELTRDLQMIDERQYVCRTRTQDRLDVFLDQTDVRRAEAA